MTKDELNTLISEFTQTESRFFAEYKKHVPDHDSETERRYIEKTDSNRIDMGTPELYYNEWDMREEYIESITEKKQYAERYKRLHSINAEKEGLKKWLVIQKHGRFSTIFDHSHSFIEINYMYSGSCTNIVDGHKIEMEAGDFVIMKPGSVHRIVWLGEHDLLMNIILLPYAANTILDRTLVGTSDLSAFMIEAIYSQSSPNHLFLQTRGVESVSNAMTSLMCEYFDNNQAVSEITVGSYLHLVFALLWKESTLHPEKSLYANKPDPTVTRIIHYIQENCADCTRESTAEHFGYSASRISNLLAEHIGKSFLALRDEFRMEYAQKQLASPTLSVKSIAEECGFTNITQFYKIYKKHFGHLPRKHS